MFANRKNAEQLCEKIEEEVNKTSEDEWKALRKAAVPQENWSKLVTCLQNAACCVFPVAAVTNEYAEIRNERTGLLKQRLEESQKIDEANSDFEIIAERLRYLSKKCRRVRQEAWKKRRSRLTEELYEALRRNRMSEAHVLRVALAGNARGPKKRFYRAPWGRITEEEWKSGLSAPSAEGG